jgi:hypothetical protein
MKGRGKWILIMGDWGSSMEEAMLFLVAGKREW